MEQDKLTYDEKKAAEAAFQRRPFNPMWSASARVVYDGIIRAMVNREAFAADVEATQEAPSVTVMTKW